VRVGDDTILPADLGQTLEAVQGFALDIQPMPKAAFSVARQDPSVFPATLWGDVLANSFVDLDKVFDFHNTTAGEGKTSVHQFGDFQLVSDATKIERHRSCGDWTIAWAKHKASHAPRLSAP
jgi:hypothetical protein